MIIKGFNNINELFNVTVTYSECVMCYSEISFYETNMLPFCLICGNKHAINFANPLILAFSCPLIMIIMQSFNANKAAKMKNELNIRVLYTAFQNKKLKKQTAL